MTGLAGREPIDPAVVDSLRQLLGPERVSTADAVCQQHGSGESWHPPEAPDAVVFPETVEEVQAAVWVCTQAHLPVIPFGTGTSVENQLLAHHGGVSVDLGRMNKILAVNPADMDATVQAGVTRKQLNAHLRDTGLFFPVDPGADASLGGMAATRASGTNAVRYGTMRENVLSLRAVLASGKLLDTGGRAKKSSAGYDLTRLFVGSEGTLGVVTDLTVRLYPIPEATVAAVCAFPDIDAAVATTVEVIQSGVPVARIELLDDFTVDAVNRHSGLDNAVAPTLFFEFHGSAVSVAEQVETAGALARDNGGSAFRSATDHEARNKLWQARHDVHYALLAMRPGAGDWPTDVCVPISRLPECIAETRRDAADLPFPAGLVGHVGDGNFHMVLLVDPEAPDELAAATAFNERLVRRALAMEGTVTGEHGVGSGKMPYLEEEVGREGVDAMRAIKQALDPGNLMNPGKIVRL